MSDNILNFNEYLKQQRKDAATDTLLLYAALKALEDITQEINTIMRYYASCKDAGNNPFSKEAIKSIIDTKDSVMPHRVMRLCEIHGDNLKGFARLILEAAGPAREEDSEAIIDSVLTVGGAYSSRDTLLYKRLEEVLGALESTTEFQ